MFPELYLVSLFIFCHKIFPSFTVCFYISFVYLILHFLKYLLCFERHNPAVEHVVLRIQYELLRKHQ